MKKYTDANPFSNRIMIDDEIFETIQFFHLDIPIFFH